MSTKAFDVIVFGATGFTGKLVAKHIHDLNVDIKWAIAGRSQQKLSSLITELVDMRAPKNLPDVLIADVNDPKSMADICGEAKIVLNCTGPFRFLGKEVVEACLKAKCTYMDICGEPQFMEQCFLDYHDLAIQNNVLILHACAFDSVPADMGVLYTMRQYDSSKCSSIESFLTINSPRGLKGHYTTYESAVHGVGDLAKLKEIREEVKKKYKLPVLKYLGKKLSKVSTYKFEDRIGKYVIPSISSDNSVVRTSHRALAMKTGQLQWPQHSACITVHDLYTVATTSVYGSIFYTLSGSPWGRSMLLSNPELFSAGIFTKAGPSKEQLANTSFQMHFFAKGSSSNTNNTDDDGGGNGDDNADNIENFEDRDECLKVKAARGEAALLPSQVSSTNNVPKACSFGRFINGKKTKPSNESTDISNDREVHVIVSGPEPGYVATPAIFFALVQCVLEEREIMPTGGVLTPCAAFYDSPSVFARLANAGLLFAVHSDTEVMSKIREEEEGKCDENEAIIGIAVGSEETILKTENTQLGERITQGSKS